MFVYYNNKTKSIIVKYTNNIKLDYVILKGLYSVVRIVDTYSI